MSIDETIRTIAYILMISLVPYIAMRVWNAVVMPDELRKPVALFLLLQAGIYTLFMVGLLLLRLWQASPFLLWVNTVLIVAQAAIVLIVAIRMSKMHAARLIHIVMLALMASLFGGGK